MKILAFDTSTESLSIAVGVLQGDVWSMHAHAGAGGAQASAALIPHAMRLLHEAGLSLDDLDAVAFGAGPGSFTGLRTACSVAQGLAFGTRALQGSGGLPVLPVPTLMAVAEDACARHGATQVLAVLDARMDEVYAARYVRSAGAAAWRALGPTQLLRPEAVQPEPGEVLAGNAHAVYAGRWSAAATGASHVDAAPRAEAMLRLAPALLAAGCAVPAAQAMPIYIRDKVAQTTEERAAAKAAGHPASGT